MKTIFQVHFRRKNEVRIDVGGTDAVELLENDEEAAYKKYVEEINA